MLHDYFQDFFDESNKTKNENNPNKETDTTTATTSSISDDNNSNKQSNNDAFMAETITHDGKNTPTQVKRRIRRKIGRRRVNYRRKQYLI